MSSDKYLIIEKKKENFISYLNYFNCFIKCEKKTSCEQFI